MKSKGFTLIELLAVIAVLIIILLIAVATVQNIMRSANKSAFKSNAQLVLEGVKIKASDDLSFNPLLLSTDTLGPQLGISDANLDLLTISTYNNEYYIYVTGFEKWEGFVACGTQKDMHIFDVEDAASCPLGGSPYVVERTTDTTPGAFGGGNGSTCTLARTIDSIEDLVYLSNMVNAGTTYSGQCIKQTVNLDFNSKKSYVNYASTTFGDINGNSVIEGLRTELITSKGFNPIGDNSVSAHRFAGTYLGNLKYIYNLYVNRPTTDYIGLFGYINAGKVTALNLNNLRVTGGNYTGGITGYITDGSITEINILNGDVTAGNYAGLVAGYVYSNDSAKLTSIVVQGDVTGADYVGGVLGYGYTMWPPAAKLNAINTGGSITASGTNVNRIVGGEGKWTGRPYFAISALAVSSLTTVNGSTVTSNSTTSRQGSDINTYGEVFTDINLAEVVFDTYISGDDDNNGYYWDYDESGTVVRKTTSAYPLTFDLSGAGTSGDPYLIADYDDLKKASLIQDVYYKVTADIDLTNQKFYMLSSYVNPTTGTFIGDTHTISNIEITAPSADYIGLFGYMNGGKVTTLNLDSLDIIAGNYTGGIVGYLNNGSVSEINISAANIVAGNYASMVAGYLYHDGSGRVSSIVVEGDLTGADYVGGLLGYGYTMSGPAAPIAGVNNGSAIIASGANVNRIVGAEGRYTGRPDLAISSLAISSSTVNGLTVSNTYMTSKQGSDVSTFAEIFDEINLAEVAFDTYISGDDDSNGYYWDYNESGTVVRKTTSTTPLTFDLSGTGTSGAPYLIADYDDLRKASLIQNVYYKLTADIDLTGQHFYMLSTFLNQTNGTFIGDAYTISNMVIDAPAASYVGLFGYMSGGAISGLKLINIDINSRNYTGGLVGYINNGPITNSFVTGNIVAGDYVGLVAGYMYNNGSAQANGIIVEGDVTGANYVGGVIGRGYTMSGPAAALNAINQGGAIISTGANVRRIIGDEGKYTGRPYFAISSEAISSITINGSPVTSTLLTSRDGKDITNSDLLVDTTYTTIGFNFTNEALPYIWELYGASATFKVGTG